MTNSLLGRADLAGALVKRTDTEAAAIAGLLDYRRRIAPAASRPAETGMPGADAQPGAEPDLVAAPAVDVPFYYASSYRSLASGAPAVAEPARVAMPATPWTLRPAIPPTRPPLRDLASLEAMLRRLLAPRRASGAVDVDRAVDRVARAHALVQLPEQSRRRWSPRILVLIDRSRHLAPFWSDQDDVIAMIRTLSIDVQILERTRNGLFDERGDGDGSARFADFDTCVALTDFGALGGPPDQAAQWRRIASEFGPGRAVALTPASTEMTPPPLRRIWQVEPWERARAQPLDAAARKAAAEKILGLLAPALRIEPGMVRAVRQALLPEADAAVEATVWSHPWLDTPTSAYACFDGGAASALRAAFEQFDAAAIRTALTILRDWRGPRGGDEPEHDLWFPEILNLGERARALLPESADLDEAHTFFAAVASAGRSANGLALGSRAWLSRLGDRTDAAWQDEAFRAAAWLVKRDEHGFVPPVSPELLPADGRITGPIGVTQRGDQLYLDTPTADIGSPFGQLPSDNGVIEIVETEIADPWDDIWGPNCKSDWVDDFGIDAFGPWAELSVDGVTQRLRWIPPGRFMLGSPADEPGRWAEEGPQTEVTLARGYWLFDTPVTQALWTAVMGENPSEFVSPDRPVEQVSWEEAQDFIALIGPRFLDLRFALPSEAQWEYACRAGTTTATYAGPMKVNNKGQATVLNAIAWYGANSGLGFDLDKGYDSSDRMDKLYDHDQAGTRAVKGKLPNNFGLFDMLGNVSEWCADIWWDGHNGADQSGLPRNVGLSESEILRVARGGSWHDVARNVRAASRVMGEPGDRWINQGFRCVAGPRGSAVSPEVRPAAESRLRRESARPILRARVVAGKGGDEVAIPRAPFIIRTDRAELTVARMTRGDVGWAMALGRDRFGLWADFAVDDVAQRLRWIPPGRFKMGSPEDEPGRYSDEGPQTAVELAIGHWLFDTPVTQALWIAVMDANLGNFVSPDRPVEQVSWNDAQDFIARMNDRVGGLALGLPSEAQWEYACRAGTSGATYVGPIEIVGVCNAPVLDAIAWYGGNSGDGFELGNGADSSGWPDKQYEHDRAGTRVVKGRAPNPFGLYDMLGNVWEWCDDVWSESHEGADQRGLPRRADSPDGGRYRVVRGGSWSDGARLVRSAYRAGRVPDSRLFNLGFRCVAHSRGSAVGPEARLAAEPPLSAAKLRAPKPKH